jgi:hypothetical protein
MATSSSSFVLNIPSAYAFAAQTATVYTDTETRPVNAYVLVARAAYAAEDRNVQVQTKVFRTDSDNGATDFQASYTTVNKSKI